MKFLSKIASSFYKQEGDGISELCFVFPNRRSSLFFQRYLGEIVNKPIYSPQLFTIKDLILSLSGLKEADNLNSLFLLYRNYIKVSSSKESFDDFLFWGEIILNDFNDIDKYLVNAKKIFTNIKDLKEIESDYSFLSPLQLKAVRTFWENFLPQGDSHSKSNFIEVWQILFPLYESFKESMIDINSGYEGMIYRKVAEELSLLESLNRYRKVIFVGLNALNECEKKILLEVKKLGIADFYWDYCGDMVNDPNNKASSFINYNLKHFPSQQEISFEVNTKPEIEIIGVASSVMQTKIAADITASLGGGIESAIVLPDEKLLMPLLHSIPESVKSVNITMGYSVKGSTLFSLIQMLLELKREQRGFYHGQVIPLLKHNYIRLFSPKLSQNILNKVLKSNIIYIRDEVFEEDAFLSLLFSSVREDETPELICDRLLKILEALLSHDLLEKIEREFVFNIKKEIVRVKGILIPMEPRSFAGLLLKLVGRITVPFKGEPLSGLQVMGVLETRSLDFENIVYCSMNEDLFPKNRALNSFIPYNLRKGFQLPVKEHEDAVSSYLFYRSIYRAKKVCLIYDTRTDGLKSGEMSRFILQLMYHYNLSVKPKSVPMDIITTEKRELSIEKDEPVLKKMREKFVLSKEGGLSASALSRYILCPLSFYFSAVEGIKEDDEVSDEIETFEFGSIFHDAMHKIYKPFINKEVTKKDIESIIYETSLIESYVDEGFIKHKNLYNIEGYNLLIKKILCRYIVQTLKYDASYAPFTFISTEKLVKRVIKINNNLDVNLKGIIDRTDEKRAFRVVDYKTGGGMISSFNAGSMFRMKSHNSQKILFQLCFYAFLLNKPQPVLVAPYFIKTLAKEAVKEFEVTQDILREYEAGLNTLIEEIFNPEIPFIATTNYQTCKYCPFTAICLKDKS